MKIRCGFVSNSSSSSFIIAAKTSEPCEHCGRKDFNIFDIFPNIDHGGDDTCIIARGIKALEQEWQGEIEYHANKREQGKHPAWAKEELQHLTEMLDQCRKLSAEGYEVGQVSISYHDHTTTELFTRLKRSGALLIIQGE